MGAVAMHQVETETRWKKTPIRNSTRESESSQLRLKKEFAAGIAQKPSTFRSRVIGKLKAGLPSQQANRNPVIVRAAKIYRKLTAQGKEGQGRSLA